MPATEVAEAKRDAGGGRRDDHGAPGIGGLPRGWSVAVQLVGTFGLAVFLVLYYVLVMQPREAARYEQLRASVESLMQVVAQQQSLLTRDQAANLEHLFVVATASEVADRIADGLRRNVPADQLQRELEDVMVLQTGLLQGLARRDGGNLSEMLVHRVRNTEIAAELAHRAVESWRDLDRTAIGGETAQALDFAIRRAAMAK